MAPFTEKYDYDVETAFEKPVYEDGVSSERIGDEGAVHSEELTAGESWYAKSQKFVTKFGVEARGIERVPSDERSDSGMMKIGTLVRVSAFSRDLDINLR